MKFINQSTVSSLQSTVIIKLLILSLCLSVGSVVNAIDFKIMSRPITPARFTQLYNQYKTKLYADSTGKVYDLIDPANPEQLKYIDKTPKPGSVGRIYGRIIRKTDDGLYMTRAMIKQSFTRKAPKKWNKKRTVTEEKSFSHLAFIKTDLNLTDRQKYEYVVSMIDTHPFTSRQGQRVTTTDCPIYEILHPVTKQQFAAYLKTTPVYYYNKREIPEQTATCPKCHGSKKAKDRVGRLRYCSYCRRTGKIITQPATITYTKKQLKY